MLRGMDRDDYAAMSGGRMVTLVLPRDFVGQLLDELEATIAQWEATASYLTSGYAGRDIAIREANNAEEAIWMARFYRAIRQTIAEQVATS